MGIFDDKVAIVTGASSGIGRATALAFADSGARVIVADVQVDGGQQTVKLIADAGGDATFVQTDVSQAEQIEAMVQAAVDTYGHLDYAFNNAGIEGEMQPTADSSLENWERVIGINLRGVWLCMKYEIPRMIEAGGGAIVNCASIAGLVGFPGIPAYVASKHGVVGLTRNAALEYVQAGIRVNAVCPGVIDTPMVDRLTTGAAEVEAQILAGEPIGRKGHPKEIAEAVTWLCSDKASFVTGHPMVVDGGWVAQ